jgi:environmental stress-induced protein Ves
MHMAQLKVLRAADYPRMPWKNGGGSTEEITRDAGTGLEGFGWRLSIADIGDYRAARRGHDLAR